VRRDALINNLPQLRKQLPECARRGVGGAFGARAAEQLAQRLRVGSRVRGEEFGQGGIAFGEQAFAPMFDAALARVVPARGFAARIKRIADGGESVLILAAQLFGEKAQLALACDVRSDAPGLLDVSAQFSAERHVLQPSGGEFDQPRGQRQHVQRVPALLAAAGRAILYGFVNITHCHKDTPLNAHAPASGIAASDPSACADSSGEKLAQLARVAQQLLELCRAEGADQAEVSCSQSRGLSVNVRMGEVETIESNRDRAIGVTVYFGQRKGSASSADVSQASLRATARQACAIARFTEIDPAAGLADAGRMARPGADGRFPEFDTWHPWPLNAEQAVDLALACEQAGREVDARIGNSDGASVSSNEALGVYANSHGFIGPGRATSHSIGCALIAGEDERMQREGWYSVALAADGLEAPEAIGRRAAERALARLDPRPLATGTWPVLFSAEMARSLIGHLIGAVSGGALYRRASFLLDMAGQRIFPDWLSIHERPFLPRGLRSAAFDAEGVATSESPLVEHGVLQRYVLGSYSARKLGLASTGNAGGIHNLEVSANAGGWSELVAGMGRGLVVTGLMGQGVNPVTGDYSRGAEGFWVENGQIAYPVDGITIAGNMRSMFQAVEAVGSDVDPRSHIRTGSILVNGLTVAGN